MSITLITRDQSLSHKEDIESIDLNGSSMPNWQSDDLERLRNVYERERSNEFNFFRSHSPNYIFVGLII